ncbi:MAG: trigger factor [Lachnospiraceae bacterium]|nr:trigger factor [Lachnospiraceae bacterium]
MKKKFKGIGYILTLTMGLTILSGCGKEKATKPEDMIDKYAAMCELGEYKGIEYNEAKTVVTDDMVQAEVDKLLTTFSTSTPIESGKVEMGDTVNIDFVGTIDGEEFQGGSTGGNGSEYVLGSGGLIPGFEDQIAGHNVGENFDINVTFPENYGKDELNGKDAVFNITINSASRPVRPEYTDEFVASNTDASSRAEYEANTRASLETYYANTNKADNRTAVITKIIESAKITQYPEQEMKKLVDETVSSVEKEAKSYGYDLATYVTAVYGMASEESFVNYISGIVEDYLNEKIVVCAIAKAEGLTVSDEDIAASEKTIMDAYGIATTDELYENYSKDDVTYYAIAEKVYDFVVENATPVKAEE